MCGSFSTQHLSWRDIVTLSRLSTNATLPEFPDADRFPMRKKAKAVTKWNTSLIIREQNGVREAVDAAWGLVPFWWSKPLNEKAFDTFNAKVERVKEAKSYRHATLPGAGELFLRINRPEGLEDTTPMRHRGATLVAPGCWVRIPIQAAAGS